VSHAKNKLNNSIFFYNSFYNIFKNNPFYLKVTNIMLFKKMLLSSEFKHLVIVFHISVFGPRPPKFLVYILVLDRLKFYSLSKFLQ